MKGLSVCPVFPLFFSFLTVIPVFFPLLQRWLAATLPRCRVSSAWLSGSAGIAFLLRIAFVLAPPLWFQRRLDNLVDSSCTSPHEISTAATPPTIGLPHLCLLAAAAIMAWLNHAVRSKPPPPPAARGEGGDSHSTGESCGAIRPADADSPAGRAGTAEEGGALGWTAPRLTVSLMACFIAYSALLSVAAVGDGSLSSASSLLTLLGGLAVSRMGSLHFFGGPPRGRLLRFAALLVPSLVHLLAALTSARWHGNFMPAAVFLHLTSAFCYGAAGAVAARVVQLHQQSWGHYNAVLQQLWQVRWPVWCCSHCPAGVPLLSRGGYLLLSYVFFFLFPLTFSPLYAIPTSCLYVLDSFF